MANIFSGLFNKQDSGSSAIDLAKYKQELEDYGIKRDAYSQGEAVKNIDPYIKQVLESMSPERQSQMGLQRSMMQQGPLFDKGLEGFNTSIQQRGTTIADILKQDKGVETANIKHQYKVDNPLPGSGGHKLEYAEAYAAATPEKRQLFDRAARARQLVDKGTHWEDITTGQTYSKNVGAVSIEKGIGADIATRLGNFKQNRKAQQSMVVGFEDSLGALKRLNEGANNWTTGYSAFLKYLPNTDAREWFAELETVGSQTVLDTMKELKSMSQTGSTGFGAVNIKELEVMMNKWGKLDEHMDDVAVKEVITRRIAIMERLMKKVKKWSNEEEKWYRDNRYNLPKSAQEKLPEDIPQDDSIKPNGVYNPESGKIEWNQ